MSVCFDMTRADAQLCYYYYFCPTCRLPPYSPALANQSLEQDRTQALNELDKLKAAAREVADGVSRSRFRLKQLEEGVRAAEAEAAYSEAARDAAEQARLFAEVGAVSTTDTHRSHHFYVFFLNF